MNANPYEVWDTDTGNLVGAFAAEEEALALVGMLVATYGPDFADDLTLASEGLDGSSAIPPLSGAALLARLEEAAAPAR